MWNVTPIVWCFAVYIAANSGPQRPMMSRRPHRWRTTDAQDEPNNSSNTYDMQIREAVEVCVYNRL